VGHSAFSILGGPCSETQGPKPFFYAIGTRPCINSSRKPRPRNQQWPAALCCVWIAAPLLSLLSNDEDEDKELALMMRKFTRLSDKIGKKGYAFDPKKRVFHRRDEKNKICYNCGEKGHISPN